MKNKKIIVSGCANCPYLIIWNDGLGNGLDSITTGECRHPSFNKELPGTRMSPIFIGYDADGKADGTAIAYASPDWCPLDDRDDSIF